MKERYLAVISVDALVSEDVPLLLSLPNSARLLGRAARVERMRTVYPSLTHPVHATLLTGRTCGGTGVANNEAFDPCAAEPRWLNSLSDIRCDTLVHAAKRAGLRCGVARWPVTARAGEWIDFLIPEVMDADLAEAGDVQTALVRGGAGPVFDDIARPHLALLNGNSRPGYDAFSAACAAEMARSYRPHLLLTHWGMVDSARHRGGLFGPHIIRALTWIDDWLGMLINAYKEAGIFEQTDFVVLSDHGQLELDRMAALNAEMARQGLLDVDANGHVTQWQAYVNSCGLSAQVFVRDPENQALVGKVQELLEQWRAAGEYGFEKLLTREEAREEYGLYGEFSFVLETDGHTAFENRATGPVLRERQEGDGMVLATHGHMPHKGPQPPLLAAGPSFRPHAKLEEGIITDVAPTLAAVLRLSLPQAEGKPLWSLLR